MTTGPERYFILVYNVPSRELEIHPFEEDYAAAAEAYTHLEIENREDRSIEVVLVGADSIETIHKTHSHYFADHAEDLFRQFLEGSALPVPVAAKTSRPAGKAKPRAGSTRPAPRRVRRRRGPGR